MPAEYCLPLCQLPLSSSEQLCLLACEPQDPASFPVDGRSEKSASHGGGPLDSHGVLMPLSCALQPLYGILLQLHVALGSGEVLESIGWRRLPERGSYLCVYGGESSFMLGADVMVGQLH